MLARDLTILHGGRHFEVGAEGFHLAGRLVSVIPLGADWVTLHYQAGDTGPAGTVQLPADHAATIHGYGLPPTRYTPTYERNAA